MDETRITPSPFSHGAPSNSLFPLALGNFWHYEITTYDTGNKEYKSIFTQKVTGKVALNKSIFYSVSGFNGFFYSSPNDSITLIADSNAHIATRYQYNTQPNTVRKIGSINDGRYENNYYSWYGLTPYNGNAEQFCMRVTTEVVYNNNSGIITTKTDKYIKPGIGTIALYTYTLKSDTAAVKEYVLTEKWELKDYYLYP